MTKIQPTDKEIEDMEKSLAEARKLRDKNRSEKIQEMKSLFPFLSQILPTEETIALIQTLKKSISGHHKKVRGSKVDEATLQRIDDALTKGTALTLHGLADALGVSSSFVAKRKKDLGLTKKKSAATALQAMAN